MLAGALLICQLCGGGGCVAAVFIPKYKVAVKKRTTNQLSVYTVELVAILTALQWLVENNENNSRSWAALTSIKSVNS